MERSRAAITLLELLVVIAMIGLLMGLLLGAVQHVRQAAARTACQNNVKQLVIGLHQAHDVSGALPTGYRSTQDSRPYTGWTLDLLPFVEQAAVSAESQAAFAVSAWPFASPPHTHRTTVIKVYTCPADPRVRTAQMAGVTHSLAAFTSYLGVSGMDFSTRDGTLFRDGQVALRNRAKISCRNCH